MWMLAADVNFSELSGVNRVVVPFLACGDLSAYDSDTTYPLQVCVCPCHVTFAGQLKYCLLLSFFVACGALALFAGRQEVLPQEFPTVYF